MLISELEKTGADIAHQKSIRTIPVSFIKDLAQIICLRDVKHCVEPKAKTIETCISSTSPDMLSVSTNKHKGEKVLHDKHSELDYLQSLKKVYRTARSAKTSLLDVAVKLTAITGNMLHIY